MDWLGNKRVAFLLLLTSIVTFVWAGLNFWLSYKLERTLNQSIVNLRSKGYEINLDDLDTTVSLFGADTSATNVSFALPNQSIVIKGPRVEFFTRIWNLQQIYIAFEGDYTIQFPQWNPDGFTQAKCFSCSAQINFKDFSIPQTISFTAPSLFTYNKNTTLPLAFYNIDAVFENLVPWTGMSTKIKGTALGLDDIFSIQHRDEITTFDIRAIMSGIDTKQPFPESLKAWADAGGVVDISHFYIKWAPIRLEGEGTLTLDENGLPLASFSTFISDFPDVLNLLSEKGVITAKVARNANYLLQLLNEDEPGNADITIPLTIQNGQVSLGPAKLFKFNHSGIVQK